MRMSRRAGIRPRASVEPGTGERGVALIMSLLVLVVISLVAIVLMSTLNTDSKVVGRTVRHSQALNYAEAGVEEALARIRRGDVPNNLNSRMVSQIFLAQAGSVPSLGTDSVALGTAQPPSDWLEYSKPEKGPDVLTVQYKTTADRTQIYKYDASLANPVQTSTGLPIFTVTSTGRVGDDRHQVVTEVFAKPVTSSVHAALAADVGINFSGNSEICGYNHRIDTPTGTKGRPPCNNYELGTNDLPGAWSTGAISTGGSSNQAGDPAPRQDHQTGFYAGPWESLSLAQTDFYSWIGAPVTALPSNPQGIYYLDNDAVAQNQGASYAIHGGDGEGMIYIDGDLSINGNFNFRGLIYIEGDLKINGTCWILGSVIVNGKTDIKVANGNCTILYSKDAIEQNIAKYGGQFVTLSWRETQ